MTDHAPADGGPLLAADPPEPGPRSPRPARDRSRLDLAMRVTLPAIAALALVTYLTGSGARIDEELHLIAPARALPGASAPVRAHFYADLNAIEGAHLAQPRVEVRLVGPQGRELASAPLEPGLGGSLEVGLPVPAAAPPGPYTLHLQTQVGERHVAVHAPIALGSAPPLSQPEPRPLRALQQLSLGAVQPLDAAPAPHSLQLRVGGGACVPEAPCVLHVHVGEPAAALQLEPSASAELLSAPPAIETSGVVSMRVLVHGPEAYVALVALRGATPVARRQVRLPVALGAGALAIDARLIEPAARPTFSLGPDAGPCLVDGWRDGLWSRSATAAECGESTRLPFAPLEPGLWRLQARRDPFTVDAAGVAVVHVARPGQPPVERLTEIAAAAAARDPQDAFARRVLAAPAVHTGASLDSSVGYLLAILEEGLVAQPTAHSSLPAARARLAEQRARARDAALWMLALSGLSLLLWVARRGLSAVVQAGELMEQAGESAAELRRHRLRRIATVALSVALLLLAYVAIAFYVRVRG